MRYIKKLVEQIDEEICGAQHYAEKYVEFKAREGSGSDKASKYKSMSEDELKHANILHQFAADEIESLRQIYHAPEEMMEKWERSHERYIERAAWIRQMLAM